MVSKKIIPFIIAFLVASCSTPTAMPIVDTSTPQSSPAATWTPSPTSTITPTPMPEVISAMNVSRLEKTGEKSFPVDQFTSLPPNGLAVPFIDEYVYSHFRSYAGVGNDFIGILWNEMYKTPDAPPSGLVLRVVNIGTGNELWSLPFSNGNSITLLWSPDKKRIAFTDQYQVRIIDSLTGIQQVELEREIGEVPDFLAWSPDGKYLAVCGVYKSNVYIIDSETGGEFFKIPGSNASFVTAMTWSPDGKMLAIGFDDGRIFLFNLADKLIQELPKAKNPFMGSKTISRYSNDYSMEPLISFLGGVNGIVSLSFSPDGRWLVFTESNGTDENFGLPRGIMSIWNVLENTQGFISEQYDVYGYQPVWLADQSAVAVFVNELDSAGPKSKILFRDIHTGKIISEQAIENSATLDFVNMSLSTDGRTLDVMFSERKFIGSEQADRQSAIIIQHYQIK